MRRAASKSCFAVRIQPADATRLAPSLDERYPQRLHCLRLAMSEVGFGGPLTSCDETWRPHSQCFKRRHRRRLLLRVLPSHRPVQTLRMGPRRPTRSFRTKPSRIPERCTRRGARRANAGPVARLGRRPARCRFVRCGPRAAFRCMPAWLAAAASLGNAGPPSRPDRSAVRGADVTG